MSDLLCYIDRWALERERFLSGADRDIVMLEESFTLETTFISLVETAIAIVREAHGVTEASLICCAANEYFIRLSYPTDPLDIAPGLVRVFREDEGCPTELSRMSVSVSICASAPIAAAIATGLREQFAGRGLPVVRWWFRGQMGPEHRQIVLEAPKPVLPEFYPFVSDGIERFLCDYLASDAAILFLLGPPGTGKTSLIRHFMHSHGLRASVTYEESLLETDSLFISFLTGSDTLLVVEDADLMLSSREHAGNKLVSRFLNVSDGLVKFSGKKIIFSTNLDSSADIDPALTRPGRCFAILSFRSLTAEEGDAAALAAGLPPCGGASLSLAELFNARRPVHTPRQIGFVR